MMKLDVISFFSVLLKVCTTVVREFGLVKRECSLDALQ